MDYKLTPPDEITTIPVEEVAIYEGRGGVHRRPSVDANWPFLIVLVRRFLRKISRGRWGGLAVAPPAAERARRP